MELGFRGERRLTWVCLEALWPRIWLGGVWSCIGWMFADTVVQRALRRWRNRRRGGQRWYGRGKRLGILAPWWIGFASAGGSRRWRCVDGLPGGNGRDIMRVFMRRK